MSWVWGITTCLKKVNEGTFVKLPLFLQLQIVAQKWHTSTDTILWKCTCEGWIIQKYFWACCVLLSTPVRTAGRPSWSSAWRSHRRFLLTWFQRWSAHWTHLRSLGIKIKQLNNKSKILWIFHLKFKYNYIKIINKQTKPHTDDSLVWGWPLMTQVSGDTEAHFECWAELRVGV